MHEELYEVLNSAKRHDSSTSALESATSIAAASSTAGRQNAMLRLFSLLLLPQLAPGQEKEVKAKEEKNIDHFEAQEITTILVVLATTFFLLA